MQSSSLRDLEFHLTAGHSLEDIQRKRRVIHKRFRSAKRSGNDKQNDGKENKRGKPLDQASFDKWCEYHSELIKKKKEEEVRTVEESNHCRLKKRVESTRKYRQWVKEKKKLQKLQKSIEKREKELIREQRKVNEIVFLRNRNEVGRVRINPKHLPSENSSVERSNTKAKQDVFPPDDCPVFYRTKRNEQRTFENFAPWYQLRENTSGPLASCTEHNSYDTEDRFDFLESLEWNFTLLRLKETPDMVLYRVTLVAFFLTRRAANGLCPQFLPWRSICIVLAPSLLYDCENLVRDTIMSFLPSPPKGIGSHAVQETSNGVSFKYLEKVFHSFSYHNIRKTLKEEKNTAFNANNAQGILRTLLNVLVGCIDEIYQALQYRRKCMDLNATKERVRKFSTKSRKGNMRKMGKTKAKRIQGKNSEACTRLKVVHTSSDESVQEENCDSCKSQLEEFQSDNRFSDRNYKEWDAKKTLLQYPPKSLSPSASVEERGLTNPADEIKSASIAAMEHETPDVSIASKELDFNQAQYVDITRQDSPHSIKRSESLDDLDLENFIGNSPSEAFVEGIIESKHPIDKSDENSEAIERSFTPKSVDPQIPFSDFVSQEVPSSKPTSFEEVGAESFSHDRKHSADNELPVFSPVMAPVELHEDVGESDLSSISRNSNSTECELLETDQSSESETPRQVDVDRRGTKVESCIDMVGGELDTEMEDSLLKMNDILQSDGSSPDLRYLEEVSGANSANSSGLPSDLLSLAASQSKEDENSLSNELDDDLLKLEDLPSDKFDLEGIDTDEESDLDKFMAGEEDQNDFVNALDLEGEIEGLQRSGSKDLERELSNEIWDVHLVEDEQLSERKSTTREEFDTEMARNEADQGSHENTTAVDGICYSKDDDEIIANVQEEKKGDGELDSAVQGELSEVQAQSMDQEREEVLSMNQQSLRAGGSDDKPYDDGELNIAAQNSDRSSREVTSLTREEGQQSAEEGSLVISTDGDSKTNDEFSMLGDLEQLPSTSALSLEIGSTGNEEDGTFDLTESELYGDLTSREEQLDNEEDIDSLLNDPTVLDDSEGELYLDEDFE